MLKVEIMQDSFGEVKWLEIAQKDVEKYKESIHNCIL